MRRAAIVQFFVETTDYVDKQSIPTAGLSPASPTALWAAGHRISPTPEFPDTGIPRHRNSPVG